MFFHPAQLHQLGNRLAHHLQRHFGIGKGDRVAVLAENCLEYLLLFAAAQKLGFILTPLLTRNLEADQMEQIAKMHPIGRLGRPEEVAELILWLASDRSSFVSGSYYAVDGGYLAQ